MKYKPIGYGPKFHRYKTFPEYDPVEEREKLEKWLAEIGLRATLRHFPHIGRK